LVSPFENMGSCIKHTGTNPRERSQLLILLHKFKHSFVIFGMNRTDIQCTKTLENLAQHGDIVRWRWCQI